MPFSSILRCLFAFVCCNFCRPPLATFRLHCRVRWVGIMWQWWPWVLEAWCEVPLFLGTRDCDCLTLWEREREQTHPTLQSKHAMSSSTIENVLQNCVKVTHDFKPQQQFNFVSLRLAQAETFPRSIKDTWFPLGTKRHGGERQTWATRPPAAGGPLGRASCCAAHVCPLPDLPVPVACATEVGSRTGILLGTNECWSFLQAL